MLTDGSFGRLLKSLRKGRQLTLSDVANAVGISVVYYRDIELGKRKPFSAMRVDFEVLAQKLGVEARVLLKSAANERGQLEFDFTAAGEYERRIAVLFAQRFSTGRIAKADLQRINKILRRSG